MQATFRNLNQFKKVAQRDSEWIVHNSLTGKTVRKIVTKRQTNAIAFRNLMTEENLTPWRMVPQGEESWLFWPKAANCRFFDDVNGRPSMTITCHMDDSLDDLKLTYTLAGFPLWEEIEMSEARKDSPYYRGQHDIA
jgi:hypothetical protein